MDSIQLDAIVGENIVTALGDKELVVLIMRSGKIFHLYPSEPECCECCYVAQITGSENLKGEVFKVKDLVNQRSIGDDWGDSIDSWGVEIYTEKGVCTFDMRLESNGYYGGSLNILEATQESKDEYGYDLPGMKHYPNYEKLSKLIDT